MTKIKKYLVASLSMLMFLSPVFAADTSTDDHSTTINYEVEESYKWSAPADITFTSNIDTETKTGTVSVIENIIPGDATLKISIGPDEVFKLTSDEGIERDYKVLKESDELAASSLVLAVSSGVNEATQDLNFALQGVVNGNISQVAGTFRGTLNFVANIETAGFSSGEGGESGGIGGSGGSGGGSGESSNPYSAKIASVQKLYDVGESALTADDIVTVNGIDCYVLQVDGNKAELITVDIYDQRFNSTNTGAASEYTYATADIKTYMDNFYTNELGSDSNILDTTVTYRYKDSFSDDLSTYTTGTVSQKVFALDAVEAQTNASKFSWSYNDEIANGYAFWVAAGDGNYSNSYGWNVYFYGDFGSNDVDYSFVGARPAFWISLD